MATSQFEISHLVRILISKSFMSLKRTRQRGFRDSMKPEEQKQQRT